MTAPYLSKDTVVIPFLAQYLIAFQKLLISFSLIAAALMIIYGGFLYIVSGTGAKVTEGKKYIIDAIIGLVIIICSYVILLNINPNTIKMNALVITQIETKLQELSPAQQDAIAKNSAFYNPSDSKTQPEEVYAKGRDMAKAAGLDPCIADAILHTESRGQIGAIGHDENYNYVSPGVSIPDSRTYFLRRRKLYSGKDFPPNKDGTLFAIFPSDCTKAKVDPDVYKTCQDLSKTGPLNDDTKIDPSQPYLGLDPDPRITHGFGLGQLTFSSASKCSDGRLGKMLGDQCFTPADLITLEGGIKSMLAHPAFKIKSPEAAFQAYIGPPNPDLLAKKMTAYQACVNKGLNK